MSHTFNFYEQQRRQTETALYLYIDIETIPSQDPAVLEAIRAKHVVPPLDLDAVKADARLTDPAKIEADVEKKRAKAVEDHVAAVAKAEADIEVEWRKTALDASTGHIVCACVALGEGEVEEAVAYDSHILSPGAEREMLEDLFAGIEAMLDDHARAQAETDWDTNLGTMENGGLRTDHLTSGRDVWIKTKTSERRKVPIIVAHHAGFDIRFVWQRAVILGVTPPSWWPIDARPWDTDRIADTMTMWAGAGNRIGLDRLCRALGLPGKQGGIDGSKVWDLVRAGRIDEVVEYCAHDVRRLRSVHRRMLGLPQLGIDAIEVPADDEREAA